MYKRQANGYEVRVFDLLSPDTSFCYNPLAYVRDDKDVLRLIETLIQSTTPPGAQSSDPFWTKSETALLQALVLYLMHEDVYKRQSRTCSARPLAVRWIPPLRICARLRGCGTRKKGEIGRASCRERV